MEKELQKYFFEHVPVICQKCKGKMFYIGNGTYECEDCGLEELDDFGKIKQYLEEHGATPAIRISEATGVRLDIINVFLREGRLEIPEGSKFYIKCEKCGCALRYGKFCMDCTRQLVGQLRGAFYENMGEKPKTTPSSKEMGKMHSLENLKLRNRR